MEAYTSFAKVYDTFMEKLIELIKKPGNAVFLGFLLTFCNVLVILCYPLLSPIFPGFVVKTVV